MSRDSKERKLRRHRERDFREKRASRAYENQDAQKPRGQGLIHTSYDITFEPLQNENSRKVYDLLGDQAMSDLYMQAQEEPLEAIPRLEALIEQHSDVPMLYNWLMVAYDAAGQRNKAQAINLLNFERHPEYIFALCNECGRLLEEGQVERVTQILDRKFDLKLRYPRRDVFHVAEFMAYSYMLVNYFLRIDQIPAAEILLKTMEDLLPESPLTRSSRQMIRIKKGLHFSFPWKKKPKQAGLQRDLSPL